jgi:HSP20 family molecular chaperone IbpA
MHEKRRRRSIFDLMTEYMKAFETVADELMDSTFAEHPSWNTESCCLEPLCNVFIAHDEVVITADLPNAENESVKVEALSEDLIEITAEMKTKIRFDDFGITHREGEFSSLRCQPRIPVPIDIKRMKISFKHGILEIRFPRKRAYEIKVE